MSRVYTTRNEKTGRLEPRHGGAVHGWESPIWKLWFRIRQRCGRPRYVSRGITVCDRWQTFETFASDILSSIGPKPSAEHSIDRINNAKGYEPGNVRWATPKEQQQNTSKTRFVEYNGRQWCVSELARQHGLAPTFLHGRLRHGWSIDRALTTPSQGSVGHAERTARLGAEASRRAEASVLDAINALNARNVSPSCEHIAPIVAMTPQWVARIVRRLRDSGAIECGRTGRLAWIRIVAEAA